MSNYYLECLECDLTWDYHDFDTANPATCPTCGGRLMQTIEYEDDV